MYLLLIHLISVRIQSKILLIDCMCHVCNVYHMCFNMYFILEPIQSIYSIKISIKIQDRILFINFTCHVILIYIFHIFCNPSNISGNLLCPNLNRMSFIEYEIMIIFVHALPTETFYINLCLLRQNSNKLVMSVIFDFQNYDGEVNSASC